jgi:S-formylglutathione hydrolase
MGANLMDKLSVVSNTRCFDGQQIRYKHQSSSLNCEMHLTVYYPPQAEIKLVPVLFWLSGLTCTDENFIIKSGAQRYAAEHGIALIAPDTSPRGEGVAFDAGGATDLGLGAGFYVNATQSPWRAHYRMYDYIVDELPGLLKNDHRLDLAKMAISGHSMGGHGAITIALKNPGKYRSVSAFAPISAPMLCPWGQKAFTAYLGDDKSTWQAYDSCELIAAGAEKIPLLVDQGQSDGFLRSQLHIDKLETLCHERQFPLTLRRREGYDHGYYFIASFIGEHIQYHARHFIV